MTTLVLYTGFNPRSRGGSDVVTLDINKKVLVSIHAPVVGATRPCQTCSAARMFQSTLPWWERLVIT